MGVKWDALLKKKSIHLPTLSRSNDLTYLLGSSSLGNSQGDTKDGVGAQLGLVWGAIELDEEVVNGLLVLDIDVLLDELGANDGVDVLNSLQDTLSAPLGLVSITELACLVLACGLRSSASVKAEGEAERVEGGVRRGVFSAFARTSGSSGWDNGTVQTGLGDNVNLDGWVSTRVVDLTSVDLGDRHNDAFWRRG